MSLVEEKKLGIYIHVPFCERKCPYCAFYSLRPTEKLKTEYLAALKDTINYWGKKISDKYYVDTIYFGGGTPNLLGEDGLGDVLLVLGQNFNIKEP